MQEPFQYHPQVSRLKTTSAIKAGVPDVGMVIDLPKNHGGSDYPEPLCSLTDYTGAWNKTGVLWKEF